MHFADTTRGRPFSKDPAVVSFQDRYWMYYSKPPFGDGRAGDGWAIGIAQSHDLEDWTVVGEILPGEDYERNGLCAPGAVVLDGQVHLFYQTYGNGRQDAICHAVSDDGFTFARNPTNPIVRAAGAWNCGRAIDADVIEQGHELFLYFATRDPAFKVQMLGVASAPLDGGVRRETWRQRCETSILAPELPWEMACIEAPALCRKFGRLFMFYGGAYNNSPQQIGAAVSEDGLRWTRLSDRPFLANGAAGEWNQCESGHLFCFQDRDGRDYLFFQGDADNGQTWYLSKVEIGWKDGLPVIAG
jgi:Glycosyl hydrolases family 43